MNTYAKDLEKISYALSNLIAKIKCDRAELQIEQEDYESELEGYDPDYEDTEEPGDPGNERKIAEKYSLLEQLTSAQDIINNL